jgi:hypothetical protein
LSRWRQWPLSLAFTTWLDKTQEHRHLMQGAATAVFAYAGGLLRKAFTGWHMQSVYRRVLAQKTSSVLYR